MNFRNTQRTLKQNTMKFIRSHAFNKGHFMQRSPKKITSKQKFNNTQS